MNKDNRDGGTEQTDIRLRMVPFSVLWDWGLRTEYWGDKSLGPTAKFMLIKATRFKQSPPPPPPLDQLLIFRSSGAAALLVVFLRTDVHKSCAWEFRVRGISIQWTRHFNYNPRASYFGGWDCYLGNALLELPVIHNYSCQLMSEFTIIIVPTWIFGVHIYSGHYCEGVYFPEIIAVGG